MAPRYRCLLIDHDDTAVDSTAAVHYPAHLEALRLMRPERSPPSMEDWLRWNFHPGIMEYLVGELGMSDEELRREYEIWRSYTTTRSPRFYPGFLELLRDYRGEGGRVAVISHSEKDVIEEHYRRAGLPGAHPDRVYGWAEDAAKRKPSPWPVREALRELSCRAEDALILDDLKPGVLMSHATGVAVAGAGWGHGIPEIASYMRENCIAYFERVEDFRDFLL
jgi:phosphoglycolate phosphatase/pyrophosphatase PpaX